MRTSLNTSHLTQMSDKVKLSHIIAEVKKTGRFKRLIEKIKYCNTNQPLSKKKKISSPTQTFNNTPGNLISCENGEKCMCSNSLDNISSTDNNTCSENHCNIITCDSQEDICSSDSQENIGSSDSQENMGSSDIIENISSNGQIIELSNNVKSLEGYIIPDKTCKLSESCKSTSSAESRKSCDIDYDKDSYFMQDTEVLRSHLASEFARVFKMNYLKIRECVDRAFEKTSPMLINEYVGAKPRDQHWKLGLGEGEVKKYGSMLANLRKSMKEDEPKIYDILRSDMAFEEKKKCIELYDIMMNTEPYTINYRSVKERIKHLIDQNKCLSVDDVTSHDMKMLEKRLSVMDGFVNSLKVRILKLDVPMKLKAILYGKWKEMESHNIDSDSYAKIREELIWWLSLPYRKSSENMFVTERPTNEEINLHCCNVMSMLNRELYGLHSVKFRFLEWIVNNLCSGQKTGCQITLKGPPGVGKTAIGKALAKALNRPFEKIAAGGLKDPSILKGSNKVWLGARPSLLLQILRRSKVNNPIIMIDEIEKASVDVQNALLDISDRTQSKNFSDNYLNDYTHDLSNVWFIYCINSEETLVPAFKDRLDIVELPEYSMLDKKIIVTEYMIPKYINHLGLTISDVVIHPSGVKYIIENYGSGLRDLENAVNCILTRVNFLCKISLSNGSTGQMKVPYISENVEFPIILDGKKINEIYHKNTSSENIFYII